MGDCYPLCCAVCWYLVSSSPAGKACFVAKDPRCGLRRAAAQGSSSGRCRVGDLIRLGGGTRHPSGKAGQICHRPTEEILLHLLRPREGMVHQAAAFSRADSRRVAGHRRLGLSPSRGVLWVPRAVGKSAVLFRGMTYIWKEACLGETFRPVVLALFARRFVAEAWAHRATPERRPGFHWAIFVGILLCDRGDVASCCYGSSCC